MYVHDDCNTVVRLYNGTVRIHIDTSIMSRAARAEKIVNARVRLYNLITRGTAVHVTAPGGQAAHAAAVTVAARRQR